MEDLLNNKRTRIYIGIIIGIPLTAITIILGFYGLILLYAGIKEFELYAFSLGVVTLTGFIGIIGAWIRIFTSTEKMSKTDQQTTRVMLFFGVISSVGLCIWALSSTTPFAVIIPLIICLGGIAFIYATPKKL